MQELRFNVFGQYIAVVASAGVWQAFHLGNEGKRRPADFVIPAELAEADLAEYLADLFHENATPRRNEVKQVP